MNYGNGLKEWLSSYETGNVTLKLVITSMVMSLLFSLIICLIYRHKAKKYFYSKEFAVALVALSVITSAVILTIQASIVVSLGMVGALSIVRFRTAIKNPLDLVFLFWSITIGIICGSGLYLIAPPLMLVVAIVILAADELPGVAKNKLLILDGEYPYSRQDLEEVLKQNVKYYNVKTESIRNDKVNLIIELHGIKDTEVLMKSLKDSGAFTNVSLMVQEGVSE